MPQAAATDAQGWGTLKSLKNDNIHKIHAPKFQGVFFLRSPKRRRQLGHRRTGLGDLKPVKKDNL